jgi:type II secretory pathway pseudopilin PulG
MNDSETSDERRCRPGFTVVELVVAVTLSAVVLVGVLGVLSAETKRLSFERELSDTRYTLRAAATAISWDLRQAATGDTALGTITDTSLVLRSPVATGVLCAKKGSGADWGYTLTDVTGDFMGGAADSVQVLFADQSSGGGSNLQVSSWEYFRVQSIGTPGTYGPALCVFPGDAAAVTLRFEVPLVEQEVLDEWGNPQGSITVPKDTAGILIGVPFMAYRRTLYGITTDDDGERWLGRRVAGSPNWELLTGPLQADGLHFSYYAADGTETADSADVVAVRIKLRAESAGRTLSHETMQDSLTVRITLRNCDPNVC